MDHKNEFLLPRLCDEFNPNGEAALIEKLNLLLELYYLKDYRQLSVNFSFLPVSRYGTVF